RPYGILRRSRSSRYTRSFVSRSERTLGISCVWPDRETDPPGLTVAVTHLPNGCQTLGTMAFPLPVFPLTLPPPLLRKTRPISVRKYSPDPGSATRQPLKVMVAVALQI